MTSVQLSRGARQGLHTLERWGILLLQDAKLPSLARLIAGEPIKGSWWGHPESTAIFSAASELHDHPDVATTKLVSGKVAFVHRQLWSALITIGRAREAWQMARLTDEARALLTRVDQESAVRVSGKAAKELEQKLLAASQQVHTESGAHALELTTWNRFAERSGTPRGGLSVGWARTELAEVVHAMTVAFGGKASIPWQ